MTNVEIEESKKRLDEIYNARRQLGTTKGFVAEWLNKCPTKAVATLPKVCVFCRFYRV
jgi:hypothetical protein